MTRRYLRRRDADRLRAEIPGKLRDAAREAMLAAAREAKAKGSTVEEIETAMREAAGHAMDRVLEEMREEIARLSLRAVN